MTAYVLYDNIFNQDGSITGYSHEVDNSGPFSHDNLLYDRWIHGQTSGQVVLVNNVAPPNYEVDTWAIFGHNLGTNGATLELRRFDGAALSLVDTITPSDDSPIFRRITPVSDVAFYIYIVNPSADDQIYHAAIGKGLELKPLNVGTRPSVYEPFAAKNSVNNHGVLLGRSVYKVARDLVIRQNAITTAELYSDYKPWLDHAMRWPFMFCWDYENYPGDSVFCWIDKNAPDPVYSNLCHLSLEMRVKAMLWKSVPET